MSRESIVGLSDEKGRIKKQLVLHKVGGLDTHCVEADERSSTSNDRSAANASHGYQCAYWLTHPNATCIKATNHSADGSTSVTLTILTTQMQAFHLFSHTQLQLLT